MIVVGVSIQLGIGEKGHHDILVEFFNSNRTRPSHEHYKTNVDSLSTPESKFVPITQWTIFTQSPPKNEHA